MEIPKNYSPCELEPKWNAFWLEKGFYKPPEKASGNGQFVIVIPPPNITSVLHLGQALNNLIQDIMVRHKRMCGLDTLWLPGTDHAGIATQNMVERELLKEGKSREDVGREELIRLLWKWKEEKGGRIIEQLKEIGCSCDWSRTRFTLDVDMSNAVTEVFVRLFEKGFIYRGKYIVNWCPRCGTALADDEVEHEEREGNLWFIKYPFVDDPANGIVVATTRPETMLGDTAVAVNPADPRYSKYIRSKVRLPLVDDVRKGLTYDGKEIDVSAEIPIISDGRVDVHFGTGAVKVTPAHDPNDYWIGLEHDLPIVLVMDERASMNKNAGEYDGRDRYEVREAIIEDLIERKLLVKTEPHRYAIGHCYRCNTVIEPYLSSQWFVRMKALAQPAIDVVKSGEIRFFPSRWEGVYLNWLENIRDWCISRQLWWGHRIPVWFGPDGTMFAARNETEASQKAKEHYGHETELVQDPDVLDTWFSSWLWPFSTMGWPKETEDFKRFYPTDVLVTASEIIFFWVARMIMAAMHFTGKKPFHTVYIHGTVRDALGRKMSKSLGNGIDPLDVVQLYGRDALRYTLISQAAAGQDLFLEMKSFETGRNFTNKLWNASRLLFMNIGDESFAADELKNPRLKTLLDKWILSRFAKATRDANDALNEFRLDEAVSTIYRFFWKEFCDWFLEGAKPRLSNDRDEKVVALAVFEPLLRLMHPIVPYLTEELWQKLGEITKNLITAKQPSIMVAKYPLPDEYSGWLNEEAERQFELLREIVVGVRTIKSEMGLGTQKAGVIYLVPANGDAREMISQNIEMVEFLSRIDGFVLVEEKPHGPCGVCPVAAGEIFLPLEGLVDVEKEIVRLKKEISKLEKGISMIRKKLDNEEFLRNAPRPVVEAENEKLCALTERLQLLNRQMESMGRN